MKKGQAILSSNVGNGTVHTSGNKKQEAGPSPTRVPHEMGVRRTTTAKIIKLTTIRRCKIDHVKAGSARYPNPNKTTNDMSNSQRNSVIFFPKNICVFIFTLNFLETIFVIIIVSETIFLRYIQHETKIWVFEKLQLIVNLTQQMKRIVFFLFLVNCFNSFVRGESISNLKQNK